MRVPTPAHLTGRRKFLREMRVECFRELKEPAESGAEAQPQPSKIQDLLTEIASAHFRTGMGAWLTGVQPDHGFYSTPADELQKTPGELRYRLKLLNATSQMMQREIDALEIQIKARHKLEPGLAAD
jgi:hypothetical protein